MNRLSIKDISLNGFKGITTTTPLDKLNLFTGSNGSGKTAHLLAPTFAITGVTSLGRTLDDSFQLSGADGCSVAVELCDGFRFARGILKDHRAAKLTSRIEIPGRHGIGLKEADALIGDRVGRFAPMFDVAEFLALSPDRRRAFLLDLCARKRGGSAVDAKDLASRAALAFLSLPDELGPGTVETFVTERFGIRPDLIQTGEMRAKVVETLLAKKVAPDRAAALRQLLREIEAEIKGEMSAAIGSAIEHVRQAANLAKREQERGNEAAKELSARKAAVQQVAGNIDEMKASVAALESHRETLLQDIGKAQGRKAAEDSLVETIDRLDREIVSHKAAVRQMEAEPLPSLDEAMQLDIDAQGCAAVDRSKLEELKRRHTALFCENPSRDALALLETKHTEAVKSETRAGQEIAVQEGCLTILRREAASYQTELDSASSAPWRRAHGLIVKIPPAAVASEHAEPFRALRELIAVEADNQPDPNAIVEKIAEKHGKIALCEAQVSAARTAHQSAIEARLVIEAQLTKAKADYAADVERRSRELRENTEALATEEARIAQASTHPDGLRAKAKEIRDRHEAWSKSISQANEAIATKEADRKARMAELDALRAKAGTISLAAMVTERERVETAIAEDKARIEKNEAYSLLEREFTVCVANAEKRGLAHDVAKGLCEAIKSLRESIMATLIAPAKVLIDRFLSAARPGVESYCLLENDRGTAIFELGWVRDGRRVALPALSGGERCLFVAALAYALTMLADPPLKLLLLEASEIDQANLIAIMSACEAVADDLGNVLIATHVDHIEAATGWNIVKCGQEPTNGRASAYGELAEAVS